jgi:catechol 2,3-dioxygenase-like lactoylglutathione lyase family enzyme
LAPLDFTFCLVATVVADLERSTRFYCDGLGFTQLNTAPSGGAQMQKLLKIDTETEITARYLRKDGVTLELVHFTKPTVPEATSYRSITTAGGPSHLAFNVERLDDAIEVVRAHGGTVLAETRATFDMGDAPPIEMILCLDPDGARIELLSMDERVRRHFVGLEA